MTYPPQCLSDVVYPEKPNMFFWDLDLILEGLSGPDMEKDIVPVSERRDAEPMEMQVRWPREFVV
jgi:hypothetical protein